MRALRTANRGDDATRSRITISATNIRGLGAAQVVRSLIPALLNAGHDRFATLWMPADGRLVDDLDQRPELTRIHRRRYPRRLPNALSRAIECVIRGKRIAGGNDLLVLGDLPYRASVRQVVFVQTPFLVAASHSESRLTNLKSVISRVIFRASMRHIHRVVVQTKAMHDGLERTYPALRGRIAIIGQPAPEWLLAAGPAPPRSRREGDGLRLFFPASPYAHKNHRLLPAGLQQTDAIAAIDLTVPADLLHPSDPRLRCHGTLDSDGIIAGYRTCDALVFPSLEESYGLPLVEAMFLGLPVLAADRPYARALCGPPRPDGAIYFDPTDPRSLARAAETLKDRLDLGWRPDWQPQLRAIPASWDEVARRMLGLFDEPCSMV